MHSDEEFYGIISSEKSQSQSIHLILQANLNHEESEVKRRTESDDKQFFIEICENIQEIMKEIVNLKNEKDDNVSLIRT